MPVISDTLMSKDYEDRVKFAPPIANDLQKLVFIMIVICILSYIIDAYVTKLNILDVAGSIAIGVVCGLMIVPIVNLYRDYKQQQFYRI